MKTFPEMPSGARILAVEDDEDMGFLLEHMLSSVAEVRVLTNGLNLVSRVLEWNPDVILLDLNLPGYDGITLCRQLKACAETSHVPVIFVSASLHPEDVTEGFSSGAADFIRKPFDRDEVVARISTQVATARANQERLQRLGYLSEALSGVEQSFLFFANHTADVLVRCAADGLIRHVSRRWHSLTGDEKTPPPGSKLWDLAVEDDRPIVEAAFAEAIQQGHETLHMEFLVQGNQQAVPVRMSALFRQSGSAAAQDVSIVLTSIADYFPSHAGFPSRLRKAPNFDAFLHDIRNALNLAQGGLDRIQSGHLAPADAEGIALIDQGVSAISRSLSDALEDRACVPFRRPISRDVAVLVVDDSPSNARILDYALRRLGFQNIETALSGEEAWEAWQQKRHPLVMSDYQMGAMSGWDLCRQIRAVTGNEETTFVGVSAQVRSENSEAARQIGIDAEISKPVSRIKIEQVLRALGADLATS